MDDRLARSFCVPFNGDIELVKAVVLNYADAVHEFYGTDNAFGSGRWATPEDSASIPEVMRVLEGSGIKFNYLLNSVVLDDYLIRAEALKRHLTEIREAGVQSVVCTSPILVDLVKELGFEACTSLMQNIRSAVSVRYHEELGYDRILVCEDDIRNARLIKDLAKSTSLPLEVIVDNGCLMECPFRHTHLSSEGIRRDDFGNDLRNYMSAFSRQCKQFWHVDPSFFLRTSWVRPEELPKLKELGVRYFKMGGRGTPSKSILTKLSIYQEGEWDGSVFDYLKPHADPAAFFGIEPIDNRSLDGYFDYFFDGKCTKLCGACTHCDKWAKRSVRLVPDHWRNRPFTGGVGEIVASDSSCLDEAGRAQAANTVCFGMPSVPTQR